MSLLMEALKKAELAKRKAAESSPAAPVAPPASEGLKLELTPTEPRDTKPDAVHVTAAPEPVPEAPAQPTAPSTVESPPAAAFTSIADRIAAKPTPPEPKAIERSTIVPEPRADPAPIKASPAPPAPQAQPVHADAKPKRPPRRETISRRWVALGVAAVLVMTGGGYAYYRSMSTYMQQQVAMTLPQATSAPDTTPASEPVVTKNQSSEPGLAKAPAPPTSKQKSNNIPAPPTARKATAATPPAPEPTDTAPVPVAADAPSVPPTPIGVARDTDKNETYALLQQAYAAYQTGDDVRAQVAYARVLSRDENNRDALLGMAAIAVRHRDSARAQDIYLELLTLDPKDSVAQAGLAGVTGALDPVAQEARIKTLLDQEPNAPHLLFAYASLLMQQQRWSEAARALQTAQQVRGDQADYAYNLAVSLDHLGQRDGALRYYRRAVDLARVQPGVFRIDDALRRIAALQSAGAGTPQ